MAHTPPPGWHSGNCFRTFLRRLFKLSKRCKIHTHFCLVCFDLEENEIDKNRKDFTEWSIVRCLKEGGPHLTDTWKWLGCNLYRNFLILTKEFKWVILTMEFKWVQMSRGRFIWFDFNQYSKTIKLSPTQMSKLMVPNCVRKIILLWLNYLSSFDINIQSIIL